MNAVPDMEISGDSYDPMVVTLLDGHVLDVQPLLSADHTSTELTLDFKMNTNVKRTLKPIGFAGSGGPPFAHVALPTQKKLRESSAQKFAPGKKEDAPADPKSASLWKNRNRPRCKTMAGLLSNQYVSRVDMDSIAMDSNLVHAQVGVPSGNGCWRPRLRTPDEKSPQKHLQLFVSVEALGK